MLGFMIGILTKYMLLLTFDSAKPILLC